MTNIITVIWFTLWISDQAFSERVLVEKRRSILPGDQREKFSTRGLNDLVVEFSACQDNRPYMSLYFCSMSKVKLKVTLSRESSVLWYCDSDNSNNCTKVAEHQPVKIECSSFAPIWISWLVSGKIQFGEGIEIGQKLYFVASVDKANCSGVTEWDWGTEMGEDTVQMTLHRSEGENRCYLTGPERVGRVSCGDRYTDEVWCLSCDCCYDSLSTDQMSCFYPQANKKRKKSCERTFEDVLGAVEFRSIQNSDPNPNASVSFLIVLKQTIKSANVGLSFGDGSPALEGIELDRSTPIPDCSIGCKYIDWLRTVVPHFYTDAGDFEAVLTITDSSRGAVPFVMRKTSVTINQRFETVSLMTSGGETDETSFQLPSFNPLLQKEVRCKRFEIRILNEEDSRSGDTPTTAERWNDSLTFDGENDSPAFRGKSDALTFEERNETDSVEGVNGSLTPSSLPMDKRNYPLTFESARNITFRAVVESECAPGGVPSYDISWSLRRLTSGHSDDVSYGLVSSATRFNIPSHSLSKGTYEVQLQVRMFDAFRTQINDSKATVSFFVLPSKEDEVRNHYFLDGTVSLTNNLSGPGHSYQWLCTTKALRDVSEIQVPIDGNHPFGDCMKTTVSTKSLNPSARNQLFPAAFLHFSSLPVSYYFHSITRNSHSEASHIFSTAVTVVVLQPGPPPVVRIKCITGCSRPHANNHSIWLEGACVNCRGNAEQLRYDWTFNFAQKSNAHMRSFNWAEDSTTGNSLSFVVLYPEKFMKSLAQDEFSFTLTVSREDMTSSEASYYFPKERPEYDAERNLTEQAFLRIDRNSSSCRHLSNVFLVASAALLSLSC